MNADDFIEIVPFARLSEANRLWADWLHSRGLKEGDFRDGEFEQEVGRAAFDGKVAGAQMGSFSIFRVRRSALVRLLPDEYGTSQQRNR